MEFKGTKGKWNYEKGTYLENTIFFSFNNGEIIKVSNINDNDEATEETKYNALLISRAPEMLEKLSEIVNILDIKCTDGCVNKTWGDFQNGNGEDVGLEIDKFIKDTEQLIKEATEL